MNDPHQRFLDMFSQESLTESANTVAKAKALLTKYKKAAISIGLINENDWTIEFDTEAETLFFEHKRENDYGRMSQHVAPKLEFVFYSKTRNLDIETTYDNLQQFMKGAKNELNIKS